MKKIKKQSKKIRLSMVSIVIAFIILIPIFLLGYIVATIHSSKFNSRSYYINKPSGIVKQITVSETPSKIVPTITNNGKSSETITFPDYGISLNLWNDLHYYRSSDSLGVDHLVEFVSSDYKKDTRGFQISGIVLDINVFDKWKGTIAYQSGTNYMLKAIDDSIIPYTNPLFTSGNANAYSWQVKPSSANVGMWVWQSDLKLEGSPVNSNLHKENAQGLEVNCYEATAMQAENRCREIVKDTLSTLKVQK